ncbi:MAG: PIN-like domain-containing protein [Cyanobacteria bacterium P01_C01_bin.118]
MKSKFKEYYQRSADELSALWADATIVLDTNVLLGLYRWPETPREDLLRVLQEYRDRLWLPYHVALEFHRNREKVALTQDRVAAAKADDATSTLRKLRQTFEPLRQRHPTLDIEGVDNAIASFERDLLAKLESAAEAHPDVLTDDPIRDRLDKLFDGKTGDAPTEKWLSAVVKEGEKRFTNKIPPGFSDAGKKSETFMHQGLHYPKKFGDLIIWKQLLDKAHDAKEPIRHLILVSDDVKSDWWRFNPANSGQRLGVRHELLSEFSAGHADSLFQMYTTSEFLRYASKYASVEINSSSIGELSPLSLPNFREQVIRQVATNSSRLEPFLSSQLSVSAVYPPLTGVSVYTAVTHGLDVVVIDDESLVDAKRLVIAAIERAEKFNESKEGDNSPGTVMLVCIVLLKLDLVQSMEQFISAWTKRTSQNADGVKTNPVPGIALFATSRVQSGSLYSVGLITQSILYL